MCKLHIMVKKKNKELCNWSLTRKKTKINLLKYTFIYHCLQYKIPVDLLFLDMYWGNKGGKIETLGFFFRFTGWMLLGTNVLIIIRGILCEKLWKEKIETEYSRT